MADYILRTTASAMQWKTGQNPTGDIKKLGHFVVQIRDVRTAVSYM